MLRSLISKNKNNIKGITTNMLIINDNIKYIKLFHNTCLVMIKNVLESNIKQKVGKITFFR